MSKINPAFERQLKESPEQMVDLIVRTNGDVTPYLAWLDAAGLQVKQQFRLSPGVAVSASGGDALKLLTQPWVVSIEPDAPVQAV